VGEWEQGCNVVALLATLNNDMKFAKVDIPEPCEYIVGIDEAGRGALAGPMAVGLAAVQRRDWLKLESKIYDSKNFSTRAREIVYNNLQNHSMLQYKTTFVTNKVIDKHGLREAYKTSLTRLLREFDPDKTLILLDAGIPKPQKFLYVKDFVKGDLKIPLIGMASIQAKVLRDRKMVRYSKKYPNYGFEKHVGYGTKLHRQAISYYGLCDIHRKSWNIAATA
jgi:ribonuclease HII